MDPLLLLFIGMVVVVGGILVVRLHAFVALVLGALVVGGLTSTEALRGYADQEVAKQRWTTKQGDNFLKQPLGERVGAAFGKTCGDIGILVALASIVGKCVLDSGAAERIVRFTLRLLGEARAPIAFLTSGFVLGIPVFFDTVFYLMIPLGKAMTIRLGKNYLLYILTITAGATMTHSLVPPTPGPLAIAEQLGVELSMMIRGGLVVGLICATSGYLYALWANRRWSVPIRAASGASLDELSQIAERDDRELPSIGLSLLPILLPIALITLPEFLSPEMKSTTWGSALVALGHKNLALLLSAAVALATLIIKQRLPLNRMAAVVQECLLDAGGVILVTAGGGAFGGMLQQTGIAERIQALTPASSGWVLPLAFLVTAMIRTAQGSATVAMITGAGIFRPWTEIDLGFHVVYLAMAIGCGSKLYPWMNDSGFWVVARMSGMTESEMLKMYSPLLVIMGLAGLVATMLGAWLLPLV